MKIAREVKIIKTKKINIITLKYLVIEERNPCFEESELFELELEERELEELELEELELEELELELEELESEELSFETKSTFSD
jgi:sensor histidine kinase YesM